jgi:peptide/nickel transport system permease protein
MTTYLVRRLLLMIPTLFGVTIVAFVIMQMAPGDPLVGGGDAQGGDKAASRDAYLTQKRSLGLDKPLLLNLNGFRDFGPSMRAAADVFGRPDDEASSLLSSPPHREFFASLKIPDFERRLADPQEHEALARSVVDFAQVWCEDLGASGVPAATAILRDPTTDDVTKRGAIRALNFMLRDPFTYTYDREPDDSETPAVMTSWRLWRERNAQTLHEADEKLSADRRKELTRALADLAATDWRNALMDGLEQFRRDDAPFFIARLLGNSTLAEKNVAALALRLHLGKPLRTDLPPEADDGALREVAENWLAHYDVSRGEYEPSTGRRLRNVVADTQYAHLVKRLATFDFGHSALGTREPVGERIWRAVKVSAPLMLAAELLIYLIAVPLGILCAVRRNGVWDRSISFVLFVLYSVPTFVAAMILLLLFCYGGFVRWFPMSGLHSPAADELSWAAWLADYAWHAFLPVVCLSLFSLAGLAMYSRASMLEVVSEDYIRTARAKGVRERGVVWRHALRNALIPVITLFADFLPALLGGSVLVEVLFSIPGMGRLSWASIEQKDYPTLMALIYIDAIVVLASILLADLLYAVVDPRINLKTAGAE